MESPLVASRWMACSSLPRGLLSNRIPLASICQQQKMSLIFFRKLISYLPQIRIATLQMSDEIAQDEEDAEDYDLESLEHRTRARDDDDDDAATLVGSRRGGPDALVEDNVVFEIGDEDDEDDDIASKKRRERLSGEHPSGDDAHERQGLIGGQTRDRND